MLWNVIKKNGTGNEKILYYISQYFKYPKDLDSLLYVSQLIQAEGVKTGVEHWRRNRGRCMGSLYWQLNDCWSVASWSGIDYFGRYKALHYFAKRFYSPIAVSTYTENDILKIYYENESLLNHKCTLNYRLIKINGEIIFANSTDIDIIPMTSNKIISIDLSDYISDYINKRSMYVDFELTENNKIISRGIELFAPAKHIKFKKSKIKANVSEDKDSYYINLISNYPAFYVELQIRNYDVVFSDNFFYLPSNKEVVISISKNKNDKNITKEVIENNLKIRSLVDTYE